MRGAKRPVSEDTSPNYIAELFKKKTHVRICPHSWIINEFLIKILGKWANFCFFSSFLHKWPKNYHIELSPFVKKSKFWFSTVKIFFFITNYSILLNFIDLERYLHCGTFAKNRMSVSIRILEILMIIWSKFWKKGDFHVQGLLIKDY